MFLMHFNTFNLLKPVERSYCGVKSVHTNRQKIIKPNNIDLVFILTAFGLYSKIHFLNVPEFFRMYI